jgi:hypothetical protein
LDSLFKFFLRSETKSPNKKDNAPDQLFGTVNVSAFELEARVLYSASPIEFADPQPETVEIADATLSDFANHEVAAMSVTAPSYELLISNLDDGVNANGGSWDAGELVRFDEPNLVLGPDTDGTFTSVFDLNAFASNSVFLRDAHIVHHDITLGTGSTSFDLEVGDVIFTVDGSGTLTGNTTSVTATEDVYLFRPDHIGIYDNGEFHYLLDNPYSDILGGITLIDKPGGITLGDGTTLDQGTIVTVSDIPLLGNWISTYETNQVGQGTSDGDQTALFIPATRFGINEPISGLHIVQDSMTVGGFDFFEGDILVSLVSADDSVGANGVRVSSRDIGLLRYDGTDWIGGNILDGTDVGLVIAAERIDAITIGIANTAPTSISIDNASVIENTDTSGGLVVGSLSGFDNENNPLIYSIIGSSPFSVVGNDLVLTGVGIDFESIPSYTVTVRATDPGNLSVESDLTILVTDVNEAPSVSLQNVVLEIPENTSAQTRVADIVVDDDALGTANLSLGGADANLFQIIGNELFLKAGSSLDFETQEQLNVTIQVDDPILGASPDDSISHTIDVLDVSGNPTVTLQNTVGAIPEDFDTSTRTKVADIIVADDPLGNANLTLSGADSGLFEIAGSELFLRANVALDFENVPAFDVIVEIDDPSIGVGIEDSDSHSLLVVDVNEAPEILNPLEDVSVAEDAADRVIDLSNVFTDEDLDTLNLAVASISDPSIASAQVIGNDLVIDFAPNQSGLFSIDVRATDGEFFATDSIDVEVSPVNDAPILSGGTELDSIDRNSNPAGQTVRDLVEPFVTDVDAGDQLAGIGIVSNDSPPSEGSWQYFDVVGNQWRDIGVVDPAVSPGTISAVKISADTLIRFLPAVGFAGTPSTLEFFAIDSSDTGPFSGPTLAMIHPPIVGASTAYSDTTAELSIDVKEFGVVVTMSSSTTSESGGSASFEVVLSAAPLNDVSISVASDDASEGITSTSELVFTNANWSTPQVVNVTGVDDFEDDGNQNFSIILGPSESLHAQYNNIVVDDVTLVNVDNDTAGIILSKTVLQTDENGLSDEFSVSLSSQPLDDVILNIATSNPEEVSLSTLSVLFTPDNWDTGQTVIVTGVNDELADDDSPFLISIVASSESDPNFDSVPSRTVLGSNQRLVAPPVEVPEEIASQPVPETIDSIEDYDVLINPEFIRREIITEIGANEIANEARRFFVANSTGEVSWNFDRETSRGNFYRDIDLNEKIFQTQVDSGRLAGEAELEIGLRDNFQLESLWNELDVLDSDIEDESSLPQIAAGSVAVTSVFTAGYLAWLIRGGHLLLGLISALPAWSSLDMLAVLSRIEDDDDAGSNSLESLVTNSEEKSLDPEVDNETAEPIADQPQHTAV